MTLIRRPAPFTELMPLRDMMERLFDDRWFRTMWPIDGQREFTPALDLYTTPEAVIAKVALPGVKPEDVDVTAGDELVTISGSFREETETEEGGYIHKELRRGAFTRSFAVPTTVKTSEATATFKDGLLTITLPKTEAAKPLHVAVQTG
jgi:HSP20 family protein